MKSFKKIDYHLSNGKLYAPDGSEIIPDHKGLISLNIDGQDRKFLAEKLISYLENNEEIKKARKPRIKRVPIKRIPKAPQVVKPHASGMPVTVLNNNGKKIGEYTSLSECSRKLGISKSIISKSMRGKSKTITDLKFIKGII